MQHTNRSHLGRLAALAVGAAGLSLLSSSAFADLSFLGVASGDATSIDAVLWTRAVDSSAPAAAALTAQVAPEDPTVTTGVLTFSVVTDPAKDYTAKVTASGLLPNTRYYYRFVNSGDPNNTSLIGTFKTAPEATAAAPVRFGFSGDADGLMRPYALAHDFNMLGLDFFVWLGDTIYENASSNSPSVHVSGTIPAPSTNGATQAQLYTDYSKKYREQFLPVNAGGQNCLQTFFAAQGNYTLYDNHELGNRQYINGGAAPGGPVGDMPSGAGVDARVAANDVNATGTFINKAAGFQTLQQVYLNYQPVKERGLISAPLTDPRTDGTPQLFMAQQWGRNAIFINADDRTYRDIRIKTAANADDTGTRAGNPGRTILGATQLAWIKQTLLDSQNAGIAWKFVAVSDPIDQLGPIGGSLSNTLTSVSSDGGKSWMGGYRAERNDLFKFIADNHILNVVFLTTDDHQNRINELLYSPTGQTEDQSTYVRVPHCFLIVDGPLGATGPETITDHTFANVKAIADSLATAQSAAGLDPVGLDANYPGLSDVTRDGDPDADTLRQPIDFYSPDTFNYTILGVSADGKTLTVQSFGINSTAQNAWAEYDPINNPVRQLLSFKIDASPEPAFTTCPGNVTLGTNPGQCSALYSFDVAASARPAPTVTCTLNGVPITSPFNFPKGASTVTCTAANSLGAATCSFTVTVKDTEAPLVSASRVRFGRGHDDDDVYVLRANDNCDGSSVQIYIKDSSEGPCGGWFVAGPYSAGTKVQLSRTDRYPSVRRGSDSAAAKIRTVGQPVLVATDSSGNTTCKNVPVRRD